MSLWLFSWPLNNATQGLPLLGEIDVSLNNPCVTMPADGAARNSNKVSGQWKAASKVKSSIKHVLIYRLRRFIDNYLVLSSTLVLGNS